MKRITVDLARRLEEAEAASWANWWSDMQPDEALGLVPDVRSIAGATCARGTTRLLAIFNRAIGLGFVDSDHTYGIDEIKDFFRPCDQWLLDLCPYARAADNIAKSLHEAGMRVATHSNILTALPQEVQEPMAQGGVEVVKVSAETLPAMVRVNMVGYEMAGEEEPLFARGAANLLTRPGVTVYLALVEGQPASVGELHIHANGVAFLAGAATRPEFRGRGLQRLLIQTRAAEARRLGCDRLAVQTGIGTQSQSNLEANGFSLAYTKTLWTMA